MLLRQKKNVFFVFLFFSLLEILFFFTKPKDSLLLKTFVRHKMQEPDKNILNSH
jgi:hypothetical protein